MIHDHHPEILPSKPNWRWLIVIAIVVIAWASVGMARAATYLPHPNGCPRALFCACGAAVDLFGKPIRSLWPSTAWFKFPRTHPARNTVAVRRGHVFVLKHHVKGKVWMVNDYNSGGRKSRYHARSIAGFAIVNPYMRTASR